MARRRRKYTKKQVKFWAAVLAAAALAAVLALGLWGCQEEQVPGREIARLLEGTWSASTEAGVDYVTFSHVEGTGGQVGWQILEEEGGVTRRAQGTISAPGGVGGGRLAGDAPGAGGGGGDRSPPAPAAGDRGGAQLHHEPHHHQRPPPRHGPPVRGGGTAG